VSAKVIELNYLGQQEMIDKRDSVQADNPTPPRVHARHTSTVQANTEASAHALAVANRAVRRSGYLVQA